MKIKRIPPPTPPAQIQMTFSLEEGWAVAAALRDWSDRNPAAANAQEWKRWAQILDSELRG